MNSPFIIYALPRSRTYWTSKFLSYGGWHCGHDELRHVRSLDDVKSWLDQPYTGTVETLAAPWWRLVHGVRHDIRVVIIRRPVDQVVQSCLNLGLPFDREQLRSNMVKLDRKLDQIQQRVPNVLSIPFVELNSEALCKRLFEFCLPCQEWSPSWFEKLSGLNIQTSMVAAIRYMQAHNAQLEKVGKQAKHRILADMARRPLVAPEGIIFQQDTLENFLRDGKALFAEHAALIGEAPDTFLTKNLAIGNELSGKGFMQITTARCNGRMFGYLMTVLGPSLEHPDKTEALHLTFYASPAVRGLGMKLQQAAAQALRDKGIDMLYMRAGVRGSGPKMGALYRRLGAEDYGQMYKLDL